MPYIGNPIYQSAFVTDQFSGTGSATAFTMSVAPAGVSNVLVAVSGVLQDPSTYGVAGTTITFSTAPPPGTGNISCRYLGVPVTGVTTTAYRTVTEFTATASQTTFTPPSYTPSFINVYLNGVLLGSADYTASNGTTVVLATGAAAGNLVTVESFQISSVANAIPNAAGAVSSSNIVDGAVTPAKLSTGGLYWDTSSNVGIGTTSPERNLDVLVTGANPTTYLQVRANRTGYGNVRAGLSVYASGSGATDTTTLLNESGVLSLQTVSTERMRIDYNGYVTTPYQPAFKAYPSSGVVIGSSGVTNVTFNSTAYNVGSCYNTSTGLFTAPVAGVYIFETIFYLGNVSSTYWGIRYLVNGTTVQDAFVQGWPDTSPAFPFSVKLSANDTVRIAIYCGGSATINAGVTNSHFAGFLQG